MEKLLDMDSPSAIGDVDFCNVSVDPFQTSSISPSLSISPISPTTLHDVPMESLSSNASFLWNGQMNISIPPSIAHVDEISSPPPFWDHSMPPQCSPNHNIAAPKTKNAAISQVISPAEIAPLDTANPFACGFRPREPPLGEMEAKPRTNMRSNNNIIIAPMQSAQGKEGEEEGVRFTPDFGAAFPPLSVPSGKALSRYTFDMNATSVVFGPPLSVLSGSGSGALSRAMVASSSASRTLTDGIRKGKVAGAGGGNMRGPSKFCHICLRRGERIEQLACTGVRCRKVTCEKCFIDFGWDYTYAKAISDWTCCHCRGVCPERAQCFIYRRTNDRRHQQLVAKKQKGKRDILLQ